VASADVLEMTAISPPAEAFGFQLETEANAFLRELQDAQRFVAEYQQSLGVKWTDLMIEREALVSASNPDRRAAALGRLLRTEPDSLLLDLTEAEARAAEFERSLAVRALDMSRVLKSLHMGLIDLDGVQSTISGVRAQRNRLAGNAILVNWLTAVGPCHQYRVQQLQPL
jgi:hypothetical protein